jgi:hypothetical protein
MHLPSPTLHTARLLLRPFAEADTDAIFALQSNPRVLRYWDAPPWHQRAQAERFIAVCRQMEHQGTGARLAIERSADDMFIGWCHLSQWNPVYRSARIGYCLDEVARGNGFATEAAGAALQWAFDTLDLNLSSPRPTPATPHQPACWRNAASSARARCARTASWPARFRIPGCTACSGGNGSTRSQDRRQAEIRWLLRVTGHARLSAPNYPESTFHQRHISSFMQ